MKNNERFALFGRSPPQPAAPDHLINSFFLLDEDPNQPVFCAIRANRLACFSPKNLVAIQSCW